MATLGDALPSNEGQFQHQLLFEGQAFISIPKREIEQAPSKTLNLLVILTELKAVLSFQTIYFQADKQHISLLNAKDLREIYSGQNIIYDISDAYSTPHFVHFHVFTGGINISHKGQQVFSSLKK